MLNKSVYIALITLLPLSGLTQMTIPHKISGISSPATTTKDAFPEVQLVEAEKGDDQETIKNLKTPLDVVWYHPQDAGKVPQYEKLELGIRFTDTVNQSIERFVRGWQGHRMNPFDPEEVDVYAEFWYYNPVQKAWVGPAKINGFYFEDYERRKKNWKRDHQNQYKFRLRFAPSNIGQWKCVVHAKVKGQKDFQSSPFIFNCVGSDNKGFVRVGENKKFLRQGDEPFFPVGQNLGIPGTAFLPGDGKCQPVHYNEYYGKITELANSGANYFRYLVAPWGTEIEFEHLGNYSDRMDQAWEFDYLLDTVKSLDMKIHYDMQAHYVLEHPGYFYHFRWDWPKAGDYLNNTEGCVPPADSGYCYRRELNLENPSDFMQSEEAKRYYKNRIRYMIARWGYSTEIAVLELFSEANNIGAQTKFVKNGKHCMRDKVVHYPYKDDSSFLSIVQDWQEELCRFIKEDLQHNIHPTAVSYTGRPDFGGGDQSFASPYVDIPTWNHYGLSVQKSFNTKKDVDWFAIKGIDKPFMHSEYGPGGIKGITLCDTMNVPFIKGIALTAFTGLAGPSLSWDLIANERNVWRYYRPLKELMENVPLDEENWQVGQFTSSDKLVEVLYLRNFQSPSSAVGVISNRSFNYFTQLNRGTVRQANGHPIECSTVPHFVEEQFKKTNGEGINVSKDVTYNDIKKGLKLKKMGANTYYDVQWINALTGEKLEKTKVKSNLLGRIELAFPGTLSGSPASPLLYFNLSPAAE